MTASAIPPSAVTACAQATRTYLRKEGTAEQALLEQVAAAAIAIGEAFTGVLFVRRAVRESVAVAAGWAALAEQPVVAIDAVTDAGGTVLAVGDHAVDIDAEARGWVRLTRGSGRVAVDYTAGISATWEMLAPPLAQGTVLLAAHLFENRDATAQPPAAVAALWRPYRRLRLSWPERAA